MTSSTTRLAELLDGWRSFGRASITETDKQVAVYNLSADDASRLVSEIRELGWPRTIEDGTDSPAGEEEIEQDYEPFRIVFEKPATADNRSRVLTNAGLIDWLSRDPSSTVIEVGRLEHDFETFGVHFTAWGGGGDFTPETLDADPRRLVRESGSPRVTPSGLSQFLLRPGQDVRFDDPGFMCFANTSAKAIALSLCNEIENARTIVLKGPPATRYNVTDRIASDMGDVAFAALQDCARWVFSLSKEAETRHILMTAELARSAVGDISIDEMLKRAAAPALEGARIAYELGLHKISADSLKALSDLRKAISDEAAKLGDSTRQLAGAVSGALFGGIGLIVVRLTLSTTNRAVAGATLLIGVVLCLYVGATIVSGHQFVSIQRDLRDQWRNRLYRFLPEKEYEKMVLIPARKAEKAFNTASVISAALAGLLLLAVLVVSLPELVN